MKEYEEGEEVAEEDMTEEGKEIKKQAEKERAEADDIEKEYREFEKICGRCGRPLSEHTVDISQEFMRCPF